MIRVWLTAQIKIEETYIHRGNQIIHYCRFAFLSDEVDWCLELSNPLGYLSWQLLSIYIALFGIYARTWMLTKVRNSEFFFFFVGTWMVTFLTKAIEKKQKIASWHQSQPKQSFFRIVMLVSSLCTGLYCRNIVYGWPTSADWVVWSLIRD